jgi:hypothetical protein
MSRGATGHSDEGSLAGSGTTGVWSSGQARSADCVDELSSVLLGAVTLWGADVTSPQARLLHTTITHRPGCRCRLEPAAADQCTERAGWIVQRGKGRTIGSSGADAQWRVSPGRGAIASLADTTVSASLRDRS